MKKTGEIIPENRKEKREYKSLCKRFKNQRDLWGTAKRLLREAYIEEADLWEDVEKLFNMEYAYHFNHRKGCFLEGVGGKNEQE